MRIPTFTSMTPKEETPPQEFEIGIGMDLS